MELSERHVSVTEVTEVTSMKIKDLIAMTQYKLVELFSNRGVITEVFKEKDVCDLIAKAFGLQRSHLTGKQRNSTDIVLKAVGIYVFILREKFKKTNDQIKKLNNYEVSESTISRWIQRGEQEVKKNPTTRRLFDSIKYVGF